MMESSILSGDQKVNLCSAMVLNSPSGELNAVLRDLQVILDDEALYIRLVSSSVPRYLKKRLLNVHLGGSDKPTVISEHNSLGNDTFYDPKSRKSFKLNYQTLKAYNITKWTPTSSCETWRQAFEEAFSSYVMNHFLNGVCCVFGSSRDGVITITTCIEHHIDELQNYCTGQWRSVWSFAIAPDTPNVTVRGKINAEAHFFESQNIFLDLVQDVRNEVEFSNPVHTANDVVKLVEIAENGINNLVSHLSDCRDELVQSLRRLLPVTRERFNWWKSRIQRDLKLELEEIFK